MAKRHLLLMSCLMMITAAATATTQSSYGAGDGRLAVIASKSFPADGISFGDLKRLYLGSPTVLAGKKLVPLTYPRESAERQGFDEAVLGMSADEAGRYWIDRKIRGQSGPPKSVESSAVVLRVVSKVDGAVGFVPASEAHQKDVKVLRVDGKLPGEPGYRL